MSIVSRLNQEHGMYGNVMSTWGIRTLEHWDTRHQIICHVNARSSTAAPRS